jgi:hypothetical protein
MTTMFPNRYVHTYTWTSPDGKTHSQVEHILIDRRRYSNILEVGSFRVANCDTDLYLMVANVRERLLVSKELTSTFDAERFPLK